METRQHADGIAQRTVAYLGNLNHYPAQVPTSMLEIADSRGGDIPVQARDTRNHIQEALDKLIPSLIKNDLAKRAKEDPASPNSRVARYVDSSAAARILLGDKEFDPKTDIGLLNCITRGELVEYSYLWLINSHINSHIMDMARDRIFYSCPKAKDISSCVQRNRSKQARAYALWQKEAGMRPTDTSPGVDDNIETTELDFAHDITPSDARVAKFVRKFDRYVQDVNSAVDVYNLSRGENIPEILHTTAPVGRWFLNKAKSLLLKLADETVLSAAT